MSGVGTFSGRARAYEAGRPTYPRSAVNWVLSVSGIGRESVVADLGAGTGMLTRVLAQEVESVVAIEPDGDMRAELAGRVSANVQVLGGCAEHSGLADRAVDAVFIGQALHWFDALGAVAEWKRVLRGPRAVAVVWNDRRVDELALRSFNEVLRRHAVTDADNLGHRAQGRQRVLDRFSAAGAALASEVQFPNDDLLDLGRLEPFLASVSYLPPPATPEFVALLADAAVVLREAGGALRPWRTTVQLLELTTR